MNASVTYIVGLNLDKSQKRILQTTIGKNSLAHSYSIHFLPETQSISALPSRLENDWVAFISEPVRFTKELSQLLNQLGNVAPEVGVIYSDSQTTSGRTILRPVYSPQRLVEQNYLGPVVFIRASLLKDLELKDFEFPQSTQADLLFHSLGNSTQAQHLPLVTYVESEKGKYPIPPEVGKELSEVVLSHAESLSISSAHWDPELGVLRAQRNIYGNPLISIVIPTRGVWNDGKCLVIDAVKSIIELSTYDNYELVLVVDSVAEESVKQQLVEIAGAKINFVMWDKPFNFSQKMNFGVLHAKGDFVLLLNDDVQLLSAGWLESMLALAQLPNAGMVGAMLYYEDQTIQHAGHAYFGGSPTHIGLGAPRGARGPLDAFLVDREVSGVTAACALMPKKVFLEVGGFTALLPGNFNDVDLCLKVGWSGFDIYWTPKAELFHFESKTRDAHVHYYELDVIGARWGLRLSDNRYWPNKPWEFE